MGASVTASAARPLEPVVSSRDPALDLLRAVALTRVVLWHMFAATWMTYFAAIPLMFFVSGSLLVHADKGQPYSRLLRRRGRRLLVPLWAYGAAVVGATLLHSGMAGLPQTAAEWWRFASWLVPVVDPADSPWHGGWLANHLWYLRAYLWIVVFSPVLAAMARRLSVAVPIFVLAIVQLEVASYFELPLLGGGETRVLLGDLVTYGFFAVLGMAYRLRRKDPDPAVMFVGAMAAAAGVFAYVREFGLPAGGINASYIAIALTGLVWVLLAFAFINPIRALAARPLLNSWSRLMNRRAVTIYLWHPAAIVVAYALLGDRQPARPLALAALTVAVAIVAAAGVGWIEDAAAGRGGRRRVRVRLPELRLTALVATAAMVLAVSVPALVVGQDSAAASAPRAVSGRSTSAGMGLPPPSYREALSNSAFSQPAVDQAKGVRLRGGRMPKKALQDALNTWMAQQPRLTSVAVGVTVDGKTWTGEAHRAGTTAITHDEDRYLVLSLTKTFTSTLVLREAAAGRINLDAPMPAVPGIKVPRRYATLTPRHLLTHTSGLPDFFEARGYRSDRALSAADAVNMSLRAARLGRPGERVHYANSNYLWLGLLLDHVTKRPYHELVGELVRGLGLRKTAVNAPPRLGWPGFSSGGAMSTVGELSRWFDALYTPGKVLSAEQLKQFTTLGEHNISLGMWPLCPCGSAGGVKKYTGIGHFVGNGGLYRFEDGVSIAMHIEPPVPAETEQQLISLSAALRAALPH